LLANDNFRYLSAEVLAAALDGARYLLEEASVLCDRQREVSRGGAQS